MGFGENMHTQQQKKTTPNIKNTTKAPTVIDPTCFPGLGVGVAAAVDVVAEIVERTDEMRVVGVGVDMLVNLQRRATRLREAVGRRKIR